MALNPPQSVRPFLDMPQVKPSNPGCLVLTDADILKAIREGRESAQTGIPPAVALAGTVALFLLTGASQRSWQSMLLLVPALFLHECGHLAAMKLFRYKNLRMLFIPFFGALASGKPDEQNAFKIAAIALCGPLAGLLASALAIVLWFATDQPLLINFARVSAFLTGLNLLPVVPLDGGILLNEALFARFPKAELVFRIAAVAALAALAIRFRSIAFAVLGAGILLTLKIGYQTALATRRLAAEDGFQGGDLTEEKVRRIRESIQTANSNLAMLRNANRLPAAVAGAWQKINKGFPGPSRAALLVAAYAAIFGAVPLTMSATTKLAVRSASADVKRANALGAKRDFAGVIAAYTHALGLAPKSPTLYLNRGVARYLTRDFDGAIADYDRAIVLEDADPLRYHLRALAEIAKGDQAAALADDTLSLALKPNDPSILSSIIEEKGAMGDTLGAIREADKVIALDPTQGWAWWTRGYLNDTRGDFASAERNYAQAERLDPASDYLRFRWVLVLRRLHMDDHRAGLESLPGNSAWTKAIGAFLLGRCTEADLLRQAEAPSPIPVKRRECEACYYIGMSHLLAGADKLAKGDFSRSVAADFRQLGEFGLARAELARLNRPTGGRAPPPGSPD